VTDRQLLGPAAAAARTTAAVEDGASVACAVLVQGPEGAVGRRLLLVRGPTGEEAREGTLDGGPLDAWAARVARAALDDPRHRDGLVEREDAEGDGGDVPVAHADPTGRNSDDGRAGGGDRPPGEVTDPPGSGRGGPRPQLYVEVRRPVPELVIVGAGHIARPLCEIGALLGFRVVVVDDRPDFATRERFPAAARLVRADFSDPFADVPFHDRSHLILVTRGHKYDYECLVRILCREVAPAYIGMIGSRRRVRATWVQLLEEGIARGRLEEIHAPVGLDIGAETPEEIAVAVAAELVLVRRGGSGVPLKDVERVATRFFQEDPAS
jgi:xanthine dehydrogenase accessory factor